MKGILGGWGDFYNENLIPIRLHGAELLNPNPYKP